MAKTGDENQFSLESLLAAIVESTDDAVIGKTPAGVIMTWNGGAEQQYGYSAEEAIGQPITMLIPEDRRGEETAVLHAVVAGERVAPYETERLRKDGVVVHVSMTVSPIRDRSGTVVGASAIARDITERRRTEAMFRDVLESAPNAMIVVGTDGSIMLANRQAERLFGFERNELVGKPIEALVPTRFRKRHRRHRDGFFADPQVRPVGVGLELFGLRNDGSEFPVEISLSPVETEQGLLVSADIRDITDRTQAEAMFRDVLESAPDAMVIAGSDGSIMLVNRQAERLFGFERNELVGQPIESLLPEPLRERYREHRDEFFADPQVRPAGVGLELLGSRNDGSEFPIEINLGFVETDRGVLVAAAIHDITHRKEAEAALLHSLESEREVSRRLRELDLLKDEFVSMVSHELRTPLTVIGGFAEVLLDDAGLDGDQRRRLVGRISHNADQMRGMVEQLLDYACLQAGQIAIRPAPLVLEDAIKNCVASVSDALVTHHLELDEGVLGTRVVADVGALDRILSNLLTNAAKFSPPGSTIHVSIRLENEEAVVSVRDDGVGIEPDAQTHVFERFYQVEAGIGERGTGIGLAIAHRYVELLGGRIWVTSEPGHGATFSFTLPVEGAAVAARGTRHTVLVVDDEPDVVELARFHLERAGHLVLEAGTGEQALAVLDEQQPDAVLLDLRMPGMGGIGVLERLRADRRVPALPVVILSARTDLALVAKTAELGCRGYLSKPFSANELLEALDVVLFEPDLSIGDRGTK